MNTLIIGTLSHEHLEELKVHIRHSLVPNNYVREEREKENTL